MGCINFVADTSVFVYIHGAHLIYILVYVDNIILLEVAAVWSPRAFTYLPRDSLLKNRLISLTSSELKRQEPMLDFT